MFLLLCTAIVFAWWVALRLHGALSIVGAGLLGFTAYSLPAVVGVYLPPRLGETGYVAQTSAMATGQLVVAWIAFTVGLILMSRAVRQEQTTRHAVVGPPRPADSVALLILLAAGIGLYAAIAVIDSPLYFLDPRQVQAAIFAEGKMMWRWVNAFGLLLSLSTRSRLLLLVFGAFTLIHCIAGDRTMVAILTVALAIQVYGGKRLAHVVRRPPFLMGGLVAFVFVLFGKPIYLSLKQGAIDPLIENFRPDRLLVNLNYFEPFGVHNQLEVVTSTGFRYPLSDVVSGVLAQFLIVPSAFGIDSSRFNVLFTQEFYSELTSGIAFNYWAQGYAVGQTLGVVVFAMIFAALLVSCQRIYLIAGRLGQIAVLLIGVLVGIYIHRNSLENIMAFIRQILLIGLPLMLTARLITGRVRRHRAAYGAAAASSGRITA